MSTEKGRKAENTACSYMEQHGYTILDRNRRLGRGELDIIATKADILVFAEVKGHQQYDASLQAMHPNKCQRIISAAQAWLGLHQAYHKHQCRFDLIIVTPHKLPLLPANIHHLPDIIRL